MPLFHLPTRRRGSPSWRRSKEAGRERQIVAAVLIAGLIGGLAWWWSRPEPAVIRFASDALDFARLEYEYPLSNAERESLTPELLAGYSQEQVDQIYGRLAARPIPDGSYDGDLFLPRGTDSETRLGEIIGGHLRSRIANFGVRRTEGWAVCSGRAKSSIVTSVLVRTPAFPDQCVSEYIT